MLISDEHVFSGQPPLSGHLMVKASGSAVRCFCFIFSMGDTLVKVKHKIGSNPQIKSGSFKTDGFSKGKLTRQTCIMC